MEPVFRSNMTVELVDWMGGDIAVIRSARVSTTDAALIAEEVDTSTAKDVGLINYLMRDRHGSPFEHNAFTFYIEAPIFVFREFMRHRIASYNEESGRYKELKPVFYTPNEDRKLTQKGKPGAYEFVTGTTEQMQLTKSQIEQSSVEAYDRYKKMLDEGIAREVARMVLPVNIYSSMFVTMNARSLMNFLSLRSLKQGKYPSSPQHEIALVSDTMEEYFASKMPITYKSFMENGRVAP